MFQFVQGFSGHKNVPSLEFGCDYGCSEKEKEEKTCYTKQSGKHASHRWNRMLMRGRDTLGISSSTKVRETRGDCTRVAVMESRTNEINEKESFSAGMRLQEGEKQLVGLR